MIIRFSHLYLIGTIALLICAIYSITTGYITVDIGEKEVTIKNLLTKKRKIRI